MTDNIAIKKLRRIKDLGKLVAGDIIGFGLWGEECLVYDYPDTRPDEIFLIGRLEKTCPAGFIGAIYGHTDNFTVKEGFLEINQEGIQFSNEKGAKTPDGRFHYGVNLIVREAEDPRDKQYEHPEEFDKFDRALREAGI